MRTKNRKEYQQKEYQQSELGNKKEYQQKECIILLLACPVL